MMIHTLTIAQMLSDIGGESGGGFTGTARPPHPDSRESGPIAELCKKTAQEQIWEREERGFEARLKAAVQQRHALGWTEPELEEFAAGHRHRWRNMRLTSRPRLVRDRDDLFVQASAEYPPPPHWNDIDDAREEQLRELRKVAP